MSGMADPTTSLSAYAKPFGASLTGTFLAAIIFGVSVLQTWLYYAKYPNDRITWKVLVAVIMLLDTAGMGLFMYCMQYYLVLSWGVPDMLAIDVKPFPAEYFITAFLVFIVQLFYINTIRALRAHILVPISLLILSFLALASALILPIVQLDLHYIPTITAAPLNHTAFNIARSAALACDIGIVAALCWLLGIRKSGNKSVNSMINVFLIVAVQRGVLQAIVQAGELLAYAIKPLDVYFLPFHVITSRIYVVSLLATLTTRSYAARKAHPNAHAPTIVVTDVSSSGLAASSSSHSDTRAVFSSYFDPPFLQTAHPLETVWEGRTTQSRAEVDAELALPMPNEKGPDALSVGTSGRNESIKVQPLPGTEEHEMQLVEREGSLTPVGRRAT